MIVAIAVNLRRMGASAWLWALLAAAVISGCGGSKTKSAAALYEDGLEMAGKQMWGQALFNFSEAIKRNPNFAEAYAARGRVKTSIESYESALADYTKAIELDPENTGVLLDRGSVYLTMGDVVNSRADFERASELEPQNGRAYASMGLLHQFNGDSAAAIAAYDRAIGIDPSNVLFKYTRGNARYEAEDYAGALEDYDAAKSLPYVALRIWLAKARLEGMDRGVEALRGLRESGAYKPFDEIEESIVKFAVGEMSESDLLALVESGPWQFTKDASSTVYFYVASARLLRGDEAGARELFNECVKNANASLLEFTTAKKALAALSVGP